MILNIVGTQYDTSKRAVEIAQEFKDEPVYAAIGIHPTHLDKKDKLHEWNYEKYKQLSLHPKVVAIGETGIDYYRTTPATSPPLQGGVRGGTEGDIQKQKQIFTEHIKLASELGKPLIIHCRPKNGTMDAYMDLIEILKNTPTNSPLARGRKRGGGVVHCFIGNWEIAQQLLDLGLYISFTGIITFKNADAHLIEVVKKMPLERVLIETDAPYLTPEPFRGKARCEPLYVRYVAEKIAEIKRISYDEVVLETEKNGKRLFLKD